MDKTRIIKVDQLHLPSMELMHRLTMFHIFDKLDMYQEQLLQDGIDAWAKNPNTSNQDDWELKRIINALIADENGYFVRSREIMTKQKIHWTRLFKAGLPFIDIEGGASLVKR